jgi:hypothetical protein
MIGVFMLLIGLATLTLFMFLQDLTAENNDSEPTKRIKIMEKDLYNGYGLPVEQNLSTDVFYQKNGIVAYTDRIFRLFEYKEDNVKQTTRLMLELRKRLPKTITLSVMPIPPRATIVEKYGDQEQIYSDYLNMLGNELTDDVNFIDVSSTLNTHRGEYIFFRTEESWTALGAYYAAVEATKEIGIEPFSLESYDEHMYKKFKGSILLETRLLLKEGTDEHGKITSIPDDMTYYYLLPNGNNQTEVWESVDGNSVSSKSPTITKSGLGTSAFVGGKSFDWAVVEGDRKSDKKADDSLLLISDSNGKILAPYFANYYASVVVVNISEYKSFVIDLDSIIQKYQVTDVVFAQKAANMGISGVSRAINPLVAE